MNKRKLEALQYCLQALEDGADLQAVLKRYPDLAEEIRPLLKTAAQARSLPKADASPEAMRLGRQRLLKRAAGMRPLKRTSIVPRLQRYAFSLVLAMIFLMSGTGLVRASSSTLPGDQLYPVKRTWEDMRLFFVFAPGHRDALEGEFEQERLEEVSEVLQKGRVVSITFTGLITAQQDGIITVSGVPVQITNQTQFSGTQAVVGASVIIIGQTDLQGNVVAMQVQVLPPGSVVPLGVQAAAPPAAAGGSQQVPGATPPVQLTPSAHEQSDDQHSAFHLEGTIQSMQAGMLLVDGRIIYLEGTQIEGSLADGMRVEVEGYFTADGRFVAIKVETEDPSSTEGDQDQGDLGSESHSGESDSSEGSATLESPSSHDSGGDQPDEGDSGDGSSTEPSSTEEPGD